MRTTLTLDDDVAAMLERLVERRGGGFKATVNEALRQGLAVLAKPPKDTRRFHVAAFNLGGSLVGSLDNVEEVLSRAEGEDHQ